MSWYRWRYKAISAKVETTYGTSAAPAYATDLIYAENLQITPVEGQDIERQVDLGRASHTISHLVGKHVVITMDIPMHTSGVIGEPPSYGHILQACSAAEVITAAPSPNEGVVYTPIDDDPVSVTLRMRVDGMSQVITGCRGTWVARANIPGIPYWSVTMTGLYQAPTPETMPTATPTVAYTPPIPASKDLTSVTLGGVALSSSSVEINLGTTVQYVETTAVREVRVLRRDPTASITCEADLATRNFFADADAETDMEFVVAHGSGANRIKIRSVVARIGKITLTEVNGATGLVIPLRLRSSTTDPDLQVAFKAA
ncbi:phage tail tube protein [Tistrella mobilis]|uniref:phage tail tube protein n=1 Tax=Tistrella mobilis TaxID=171437 RepID=UPI003555E789